MYIFQTGGATGIGDEGGGLQPGHFNLDYANRKQLKRRGPFVVLQAVPREMVEAETDHGAEEYDVYVHDSQPLAAGEEKHMLSVFVADEKGLINRVAGVFARRGAIPQCNTRH